MRRSVLVLVVVLACGGSLAFGAEAPPVPGSPAWADTADVTEHLGAQLPLDLPFTDSTGARVPLRSLFDGVHPVLLVLAYYQCPQLCSLVLDGAVRAMHQLDSFGWHLGPRYRVATISFDANERIDQAARKQTAVLAGLGRTDRSAWPFFVGDDASITALTRTLGFKFLRDPHTGTLAHTAVVFVISPTGMISRYLYGTEYPARDLKLALLEASDGKTGTVGDKILLRCFHYDPATRRYGLFISRFMKIGGLLIFLIAAAMIFTFARHEKRRRIA